VPIRALDNPFQNIKTGFARTWHSAGPFSNWKSPLGFQKRLALGASKVLDLALSSFMAKGDSLARIRFFQTWYGNSKRMEIYDGFQKHFDGNGLAITEKGRLKVTEMLQEAANEFLSMCNSALKVEGEELVVSPLALFGSYANGTHRLGLIFPKIGKFTSTGQKPSDIDILVRYNHSNGSQLPQERLDSLFEKLRNDINDHFRTEYGIDLHLVSERAPEIGNDFFSIPIEDLKDNGLAQHMLAGAGSHNKEIELTDSVLPPKPVRLMFYHDTSPENAENVWRKGSFDPEVRSRTIVYDQPSGIYCSTEKGMMIGPRRAGVDPRVILELRADIKKPLDARDDAGMAEYKRLLQIARKQAKNNGVDISLAQDRPKFGKVFTGVLLEAGYDCVILTTKKGEGIIVILKPENIEVASVRKHYQYRSKASSNSFLTISMDEDTFYDELPSPEWAATPPGAARALPQ
jgi:hypothetical protein